MVDAIFWLERRGIDEIAAYIWVAQMGVGIDQAEARRLISSLAFATSKSIRTSTIILASFNGVAAFATAFSILYDCYCAARRYGNGSNSKKFFLWAMHPAETFPLVLALGIVLQGVIFAVAQSYGLQSLMVDNCGTVAQFVFPATFLPSYIHIVFGMECAIRSVRKDSFGPRGKYDVLVCLGVIVLMVIGTWIPTQINKQPNICFASLMWFVTNFGIIGLGILSSIAFFTILSSITIFYRLSTEKYIDQCQRIAASRVVYYLALKLVGLAFIAPWFVSMTIRMPTMLTAMMATVVLNLVGLTTGALQLFLRANTVATSFRPKGTPGWSGKKREIRIWGPNDLGFSRHILQPLSDPWSPVSSSSIISFPREKYWATTPESSQSPFSLDSKAKNAQFISSNPSPVTPTGLPSRPNQDISPGSSLLRLNKHKPSQFSTLFPNEEPSTSSSQSQGPSSAVSAAQSPAETFILPSKTYINPVAGLLPPPALLVPRSHKRESSMVSSATVQIGIRLTYKEEEPCPLVTETQKSAYSKINNLELQPRRSELPPLQIQTENLPPQYLQLGNKQRLSPQERAARMKTLPPVPRSEEQREADNNYRDSTNNEPRLSPTVYMPPSRLVIDSAKGKLLTTKQEDKPRTSRVNWI